MKAVKAVTVDLPVYLASDRIVAAGHLFAIYWATLVR